MGKIIQLPESLSNMIAAGEVVENMASVVKELLENALDANSQSVTVQLEQSGLKKIHVIDDGEGIAYEDLPQAFKRHATSKIKTHHDLHHIHSLGFRGEALPSIASVSELTIESASASSKSRRLALKNGKIIADTSAKIKQGTSVIVNNIFYNTPARLKHLKSEQRELAMIVDYVNKIALAHPNVAIKLIHNQRTLLNTVGDQDTLKILAQIYDIELVKNMLSFSNKNQYFSITGICGKPAYHRATRQHVVLIANHRLIRNQKVVHAVIEAYKSYLPIGKYPIVLLNIEVDPLLIDVNIHPQKLEIKFSEESALLALVRHTIRQTLENTTLITGAVAPKSFQKEAAQSRLDLKETQPPYAPDLKPTSPVKTDKADACTRSQNKLPELEFIGQAHGTYLIFQNETGLFLLDQHAAEERIRYERYLDKLSIQAGTRTLLIPVIIRLSSSEATTFDHIKKALDTFGIEATLEGNNMNITRLPNWIPRDHETHMLDIMIQVISEDRAVERKRLIDKMATDLACKHSIKANRYVRREEVSRLLQDLDQTDNPYHCPHGRPTLIEFDTYALEKMFKRVQS